MSPDDFVRILRKGPEKLRVDSLILKTCDRELHGKGLLHIANERFWVEMTLDAGETPPQSRTGVFTMRDAWKLTGIIEDTLHFKSDHVGPSPSQSAFHRNEPDGTVFSCYRLSLSLNPIELLPCGWDSLTTKERRELRERLLKTVKGNDAEEEFCAQSNKLGNSVVSFSASFNDFPLQSSNWESSTKGEAIGFVFEIFEQKDGHDPAILLRAKDCYASTEESEHWKAFYAFMNALAFIYGTNAWPYRIEYWRDGVKVTDRITPICRLPRTAHAPFPEALQFNAKTGSVQWSLVDTIRKVALFFASDSDFSKEVSKLLFLFRQAGDRIQGEITTLTLCILFENLFQLIFKHLKLEQNTRRENAGIQMFEEARDEIAEGLQKLIPEKGEGYKRLADYIKSGSAFNQRLKCKAVVEHLGLKWEGNFELVFKTWQKARNPMVHGKEWASQTEDEIKHEMMLESEIAGAINVLLLKLFGYSGIMKCSAFENKYRKV